MREILWRRARVVLCAVEQRGVSEVVAVTRIGAAVEAWEMPWSSAHGAIGLLCRGTFTGMPLVKRAPIETLADGLGSCAGSP